jgi:adenine-specific DNA-methyltransferase
MCSTLHYIGSKKLFLNILGDIVCEKLGVHQLNNCIFYDLFAGTCCVSGYFNQRFHTKIICNDIEKYSNILGNAILKCTYSSKLKLIAQNYQNIGNTVGFCHEEFAIKRKIFTPENASIIDTIRDDIFRLKNVNEITSLETDFLLASLLTSADKVANTTSVYASHLKSYKRSSLTPFIFKPIHTYDNIPHQELNMVLNKNANDVSTISSSTSIKIAFIDPPYVARHYGAYYGPLNAIVEENPKIYGIGAFNPDYYRSEYSTRSKNKALHAFNELINNISADYLIITYASYGLIDLSKILEILESKGSVSVYNINLKKFNTKQSDTKNVDESWFFVECN